MGLLEYDQQHGTKHRLLATSPTMYLTYAKIPSICYGFTSFPTKWEQFRGPDFLALALREGSETPMLRPPDHLIPYGCMCRGGEMLVA